MSHVTDTFLFTTVGFDPSEYDPEATELFEKIQEWLQDDCGQKFKRLDNNHKAYGGHKVLQLSCWVGAFNYLSLDRFIDFLEALPWPNETVVQLAYQDEHDNGVTLRTIS